MSMLKKVLRFTVYNVVSYYMFPKSWPGQQKMVTFSWNVPGWAGKLVTIKCPDLVQKEHCRAQLITRKNEVQVICKQQSTSPNVSENLEKCIQVFIKAKNQHWMPVTLDSSEDTAWKIFIHLENHSDCSRCTVLTEIHQLYEFHFELYF